MTALTEKKNLISTQELQELLLDIKEQRPDICIRYRLLGEMWTINFLRVFYVGRHGAMFNDELNNRIISLSDLSAIMQFEIDAPHNGYQPHYHYHVQPFENGNGH